jgi:hypothetical protein
MNLDALGTRSPFRLKFSYCFLLLVVSCGKPQEMTSKECVKRGPVPTVQDLTSQLPCDPSIRSARSFPRNGGAK